MFSTSLRRAATLAVPATAGIAALTSYANADTTVTTVTTVTTTTTTTETIPDVVKDPNYPPYGISPSVQKLEKWIQVGCGDVPYNCPEKGATFAVDGNCPDKMPDLSKHSNFMAECMTEEIYNNLKNKKTSSGVTLAHCIKTGVDNPGHPHIKTVGMTAGDEDSYSVFAELFDPIIDARHNGYGPEAKQPTNMDLNQLSDTDIDPTGKYVLTTRVRTGRSIKGFQLPPCISFEERRKLEAVAVKGLLNMKVLLRLDSRDLHVFVNDTSYHPNLDRRAQDQHHTLTLNPTPL